jgi:hypothetical protein
MACPANMAVREVRERVEREETELNEAREALIYHSGELVKWINSGRREGGEVGIEATCYLQYQFAAERFDALCRNYFKKQLPQI